MDQENNRKSVHARATDGDYPAQTFTAEELTAFGVAVLTSAGASAEEAQAVTDELVAADAAGHPSHGVMRLIQYVNFIEIDLIRPGARLKVVSESAGVDVFDGQFGLGQFLMREFLDIAYRKAREHGSYTAFARHFNHIGRLGSYAEDAARNGFLAMMMVNVNGASRVATYGAAEPRLGTNPICIAMPNGDDWPVMVDTATCVTAEGKVRIAMQNDIPLPDGQIIDKDGNPTNDPAKFYTDPSGAILPMGGPVGYKGSGLAIMVEMMCGILSGAGFGRHDVAVGTNAVWLNLVDLGQVIDTEHYEAETKRFIVYIKQSRPLPGVDEIMLPGEVEHRRAESAKLNGIQVLGGTWHQLSTLAAERGVKTPAGITGAPG
jgi:uncharacterized oxidoreductase